MRHLTIIGLAAALSLAAAPAPAAAAEEARTASYGTPGLRLAAARGNEGRNLGGFGLVWVLDRPSWSLDLAGDFLAQDVKLAGPSYDGQMVTAGANVSWHPTREDSGPSLGGGLAWSWSHLGGLNAENGAQWRLAAGWDFGRTSAVAFRLEGTFWFDAFATAETGHRITDFRRRGLMVSLACLPFTK